jgi:hypothetical protein
VNSFEDPQTAVADCQPGPPPRDARIRTRRPTIIRWSVVGHDRLIGSVYQRPGQADGGTVMTSPVVQVRRMGDLQWPVAFTASGTAYWLGAPARPFGVERAQQFVRQKARVPACSPPHSFTALRNDSGVVPVQRRNER